LYCNVITNVEEGAEKNERVKHRLASFGPAERFLLSLLAFVDLSCAHPSHGHATLLLVEHASLGGVRRAGGQASLSVIAEPPNRRTPEVSKRRTKDAGHAQVDSLDEAHDDSQTDSDDTFPCEDVAWLVREGQRGSAIISRPVTTWQQSSRVQPKNVNSRHVLRGPISPMVRKPLARSPPKADETASGR